MSDQTILTICGSLRSGSLNRSVEASISELGPEGMTFVSAPSIGDIPHYNADIQSEGFPEAVVKLGDAIRSADAVIIVSPEYNYSVPGVLKNAIDWISRLPDQPFKNKPVALQSAAGGLLGGSRMQYHLRQIMVFLEANVLTKPEVFITFGNTKIEGGKVKDEATREAISAQLAAFQSYIGHFK